MIFVRGADSAIARALAELHAISPVPRGEWMPDDGELYLYCQGLLQQKPLVRQTDEQIAASFAANALSIIKDCERLFEVNKHARVCVVGSESAFTWSYDGVYAAAKAALHRYVETKRLLHPAQQLVCVSPTVVMNTNMTNSRDEDGCLALMKRQKRHPKSRWLEPIEVARMIYFLLCVDLGYTTNVVIRMNGGEHCGSPS